MSEEDGPYAGHVNTRSMETVDALKKVTETIQDSMEVNEAMAVAVDPFLDTEYVAFARATDHFGLVGERSPINDADISFFDMIVLDKKEVTTIRDTTSDPTVRKEMEWWLEFFGVCQTKFYVRGKGRYRAWPEYLARSVWKSHFMTKTKKKGDEEVKKDAYTDEGGTF